MGFEHVPVLLDRVLAALPLKEGALIVDGTLGLGGYSEAFLSRDPTWRVIGIDRDAKARAIACERLKPFGEDVLIRPDVSFMGRLIPHDAAKCISIGRAAASEALPEIRRLLEKQS